MSSSWVLKFPRSDDEGFLLLQVSSIGDSVLDLNLLATEGEAPYRGKIRQRKITNLRAKNFHGSDDEWQNILRHVFNPQSAPSLPDDIRKGLETVTTINKGKATIAIRNRIDKITQRLGSIEISQDDDAEIQLFDWCGSAIDQKATLEAEKADLQRKYECAQSTIASLDARLEELVKAKAENEEELISKFVLLLNEKKLKIRNQQRLLSTAKIDQKKLKQMEKTLDGKGRKAEPSRSGKRRANAEPVEEEAQNDESSDDAFEKMDLDKQEGIVAASQEASSERQTTPEPATGSETESDPEPDRAQPISRTKQAQKPQTGSQNPTTSRPTQSQTGKKIHPSPPPPVRHLPFAKTGARNTGTSKQDSESAQKQQPKAPVRAKADEGAGEETASEDDDDEL